MTGKPAERTRVERARTDHGYGPGWIVLWGIDDDAWSWHDTWAEALRVARGVAGAVA